MFSRVEASCGWTRGCSGNRLRTTANRFTNHGCERWYTSTPRASADRPCDNAARAPPTPGSMSGEVYNTPVRLSPVELPTKLRCDWQLSPVRTPSPSWPHRQPPCTRCRCSGRGCAREPARRRPVAAWRALSTCLWVVGKVRRRCGYHTTAVTPVTSCQMRKASLRAARY